MITRPQTAKSKRDRHRHVGAGPDRPRPCGRGLAAKHPAVALSSPLESAIPRAPHAGWPSGPGAHVHSGSNDRSRAIPNVDGVVVRRRKGRARPATGAQGARAVGKPVLVEKPDRP